MGNDTQKTILLVEDEAIIAINEKRILENYGYRVIIKESGKKAIETLENSAGIDLILMDIDLGKGMNGTQAAEIILEKHELPLIFLSSHTNPEVVEKTEGITSYGYIVKNSGETVLIASIKMAFKLFNEKLYVSEKQLELETKNIELTTKERFLNRIIEQSPFATWISDSKGTLLRSNKALKNFLNLSEDQLVGKYNVLKDPLTEKQGLLPLIQTVFNEGKTINFTCDWDGNDIPSLDLKGSKSVSIEATMFPIHNMDGKISNVVLNWIDITERKKMEQALVESERKWLSLVQNFPGYIIIVDSSGSIQDINRALPGFKKEEVIGTKIFDYEPPETRAQYKELLNKIFQSGQTKILETRGTGPNNSLLWHETRMIPIVRDSHITHAILINVDITERKHAEDLVRIQRDLAQGLNTVTNLRDAMSLSLDAALEGTMLDAGGVYLVDENTGNLNLINSRGLSPEFIETVSSYDAGSPNTTVVMKGDPIYIQHTKLDLTLSTIEKNEGLLMMIVFPISYHGRVISCLNVASHTIDKISLPEKNIFEAITYQIGQTISRLKTEEAQEKALLDNKNLLRELQHRAKNSFTMIRSMISITADSKQSDDARSALKEINSRIKAISEVYDLLYSSESVSDVQLDEYIKRLASSLQHVSENITIREKYDSITLPVKTSISVGIIISELITNSLKHAFPDSRRGTITLTLKKSANKAIIELIDDGTGLPEGLDLSTVDSMGFKIINALTSQIDGSFKVDGKNGTHSVLEFPLYE